MMSPAEVVTLIEAATKAPIVDTDTIESLRVTLSTEIGAGRADLSILAQNATVAHVCSF